MPDPSLPSAIPAYLERQHVDAIRVDALTGDASDRRYFRVLRRNGPSRVLALHVEPFDPDALPFCRVAQLLAAMPLPETIFVCSFDMGQAPPPLTGPHLRARQLAA